MSTGEIKRKFCPYCGTELVNPDREFCHKCGMQINDASKPAIGRSNRLNTKTFCPNCRAGIKEGTIFCNKCGQNIKEYGKGLINRINEKINILSVFIGLAVTILVLFLGSFIFGWVITSKIMHPLIYLYLLIFTMLFAGGLVAGVFGSRNIDEGMVNGGFLSLIALIFVGFIFGTYLLAIIGLASIIASAFSGIGTPAASTTATSSPNMTLDDLRNMPMGIVGVLIILLSGIGGGALGGWIKEV